MDATEAAKNTLEAVLDAKPGERLLIIADDERSDVAHAFGQGALKLGLWIRIVELKTSDDARKDVPRELEETILSNPDTDIFINFLRGRGDETPFRIKVVGLETRRNVRLGHCPGTTYDMLTDGALALSLEEHQRMQKLAKDLILKLKNSTKVHLTTPAGTNIELDVTRRPWFSDTYIDWSAPKLKWMNLPTGETLIGPQEFGANGTLVCDLAMGGWKGEIPSPVFLRFVKGKVVSMECENSKVKAQIERVLATDEWANHIGEFAFGINNKARIHDEFVETEKIKTVHIAVGNNLSFPGGCKNASANHLDFLVKNPSVEVTYADGKRLQIMKSGEYLV